jgi:tetratricopeptide (TPR) repeat protein
VIPGASDIGDAAPGARPVSAATRQRLERLRVELDVLEMVPFSDPDAAYAPAAALERRARALGDETAERRAQLIQADVLCRKGKHTASGQVIREINEWATEHGDRHLMARSHRLLSVFFDFIGDVPSAWEHAVPAVDLLDDTMPERMRADHIFGLGQVLVRTGAWDAARERYRAALELADGLDDVPLRVKILNNLAWLEDDAGDVHQSMEIAKRMQAFAERHNVALDAACLDTIANAQLKLGLYAEAEATLRPILDAGDLDTRPIEGLAEALNTAAGAQRLQGHMEDAGATLDRCIELCASRGMVAIRVEALEERARLYADQGLFERAYQQYIEFHAEDAALRAAQREANARTLQAVFETTEARREGERFASCHSATRSPACGIAVTSIPSCPSCSRVLAKTAPRCQSGSSTSTSSRMSTTASPMPSATPCWCACRAFSPPPRPNPAGPRAWAARSSCSSSRPSASTSRFDAARTCAQQSNQCAGTA